MVHLWEEIERGLVCMACGDTSTPLQMMAGWLSNFDGDIDASIRHPADLSGWSNTSFCSSCHNMYAISVHLTISARIVTSHCNVP